MQEPGLTDIIPFICISALWASMLHFFTSWASVLTTGSGCSHGCQITSASWVPSGLRNSHLERWNHWWPWHPFLLIWQEILHFLNTISKRFHLHKLEFSSPVILCKTFPHLSFQIQNTQELGSYFTYALINFPEVSRPGLPYTVAISHMWLYLNS